VRLLGPQRILRVLRLLGPYRILRLLRLVTKVASFMLTVTGLGAAVIFLRSRSRRSLTTTEPRR
jgi:hypothetical protein